MEMVTIALIIIGVNILITTLILDFFMDLILERFKVEDKFDESVIKAIKDLCKELNLECKTSTITYNKIKRK